MPNLRDRDGVYWTDCYFIDPRTGKRKRVQRSTGIKNDGTRQSQRTAERAARDLEESLANGRDRKARGISLAKAFDLRVAERELEGAADASVRIILEKAAHTLEYFKPTCDVATITEADLKAYATYARTGREQGRPEAEARAPATVVREITELRCALRAAGVEPPPAPNLGPGGVKEIWFNSEDSAALIAEVAESRRDHVITYRLTGVRYDELHRIERRDLLGTGMLRVRGTKTKTDSRGGADRTIPLHPQVAEILARRAKLYPKGALFPDRWLSSNGGRDLTAAGRRAGLMWNGELVGGEEGEPIAFNVLRASFCTELVLAGVPLKKVAYLMGHKTTHMVERVYTRFFGAEVGLDLGGVLSGFQLQPKAPDSHRHSSVTDSADAAGTQDAPELEKE